MNNIMDFIVNLVLNEGIIIAVAAFVVGEIIKTLAFIPDKYIPLIGGILGIILGITIPHVFVDRDIITSGILGLTLGWAATGGYETVNQLRKEK